MPTLTLEDVRARIIDALGFVPQIAADEDWWVTEAARVIFAYRAWQSGRRVYDVSTVGMRIRTAREVVGLSQGQLAQRLDVRQEYLSRWERGERDIPATVFSRLCLSLGVTEAWTLGDTEEGGPPLPTGVLRKQTFVNWRRADQKTKKKAERRAERERLQGLRPPKPPRPKPVPSEPPPEPEMPPCPRCGAPLLEPDATFCIADGCGWPGAAWKPDVGAAAAAGTQRA